jgi:hypothetical protein
MPTIETTCSRLASADFGVVEIREGIKKTRMIDEAASPGGTAGTDILTEVEVEASGPCNEGPEII